jgi:phosphoglycerate dehydrogenase-like enzyme
MNVQARIFIASDFVLDVALDAAAGSLAQRGYDVVRGPRAVPGTKTVFDPADHDVLFARSDVLVVTTRSVVDDAILDAAPRLRGIVFPSIGTESLDMTAASARGLIVANGATPENFESMAEATVMLILNLLYDLRGTERVLRDNAPRPAQLSARMLKGKTLGLIGLGRIARGVVARLAGWGVDIVCHKPGLAPGALPTGVRPVALEELLRSSDVVSVHTTLTASTTGLVGAKELALMKPTAFLINTARGLCVDEDAVHAALARGAIAGAALDAFRVEPLPPDSALRALPNAILTPHMVGHTRELFASFAPACVANVEAILAGRLPPFTCNTAAEAAWRTRLSRLSESA